MKLSVFIPITFVIFTLLNIPFFSDPCSGLNNIEGIEVVSCNISFNLFSSLYYSTIWTLFLVAARYVAKGRGIVAYILTGLSILLLWMVWYVLFPWLYSPFFSSQ